MDFNLTEEQKMIRTQARDFLEEKCPTTFVRTMETDDTGYSTELWKEMAGLGWMGLALPEDCGGSGMAFIDLVVLLEEMGRACLPGPFFSSIVLGGLTILDAGDEAQKQQYLPGIAEGETVFSLALTEPGGRYDAASITTTATRENGDYLISGTKLFVPDAHVADYLLCVARTGESPDAEKALTVFIVDAASPGISRSPLKTFFGNKQSEVVFDGVRVPAGNVLGEPGAGWEIVRIAIERAAAAGCCDLLGSIQKAMEMTLDYAKERRQYDRPIGSFQVIQHYCAQMATDVDATRFSTYQAAWMLSEGLECSREVAIAKAWANEAFERVMTKAHQIHGAIGCTIDHDLQLYTKRGKAAQLNYGSGDFHREILARQMGL